MSIAALFTVAKICKQPKYSSWMNRQITCVRYLYKDISIYVGLHIYICIYIYVCIYLHKYIHILNVILFMGFSRQEYWSGLPFPPPVDYILSELFSMIHLSWWSGKAWLIASLSYTVPSL